MSDTDLDLLRQFTRDRSQDAFTTLVKRHVNLVHSAALRQVRSPQLAEEVAQSVFADLARHAAELKPGTVLTAWLYQVTRWTAIDVVRKESRRQLREQIAVEMTNMNATAADWTHIAPLLDDAMAALDETDRSAILLRYFENQSLREVGAALGTSDDAAQKRVSRAVEQLREFFSQRNVTIGASGLVVVISANAVQAAPIGLAATISAAAVLAGTAVHTSTVIAATKAIAMTTIQKALITATLAVVAGAGIYEAHQAAQLREQNQTLQQQQAPLADQIQQMQRERDDATNRLADLQDELAKANSNNLELLKLRNEVTMLKRQPLTQSPIEDDSWEVSTFNPQPSVAAKILDQTKPQVRIVDSKYDHFVGRMTRPYNKSGTLSSSMPNASQSIGIGIAASEIILTAYESTSLETIFPADMPTGKYDYIANLPQDSLMRLREEIQTKFGLVGKMTMVTTNAFALVHTNPDLPVIKEPRHLSHFDRLKAWREMLENVVTKNTPIVDLTGLTNQYEWEFSYKTDGAFEEKNKQEILQAFHDQLGLDLVATNMPIEMLVVEKVK
jgi:RNA polymerase sigma factor (sigma-70 family)